jgi:dipeptidyl-peptidase-4
MNANANLSGMKTVVKLAAALLLPVLLASPGPAAAQGLAPSRVEGRRLSTDLIFHPERRLDFSGTPVTSITWLDAQTYVVAGNGGWQRVDAVSGRTSPLFDPSRMENALASLPGISREIATGLSRSRALTFNAGMTLALMTINDDLYVYDMTAAKATRLTATAGEEEEATFSPDGRSVGFVRGNNLHVVSVSNPKERAVTRDGGPQILNGKLDWLYQEELYGRGQFRSYWWSPDSSRIAFLRLDETPVPEYTVVDHIPYRPVLEVTDYPKAGDPNPTVRLGIARAAGGVDWVDLKKYESEEFLLVNVDWTPDSSQVVYQVQNREQTWLDLNLAQASSGRSRTLLRETTKAWVDRNENPLWLKDGSFLWMSVRSGFNHVYHYGGDGTLRRQVTNGRWEVRALYGADEAAGVIYFTAPERSNIDSDIYRVRLDGTGFTRLSASAGANRAIFNPSWSMYVGVWSDATTPNQVRLHRSDGSVVRVLDANPVKTHAEFQLSRPEFVKVKARDGFVLDGMMIKPPDFDPSQRYPVFQFTYAGPTAAVVRNAWRGTEHMFHQMLAQHGVIVWLLDNRSASGQGAESQWPVYGRLGEMELQDLEDGVTWLKTQPYIDASRIALYGWSYGGFMTAYALTHSTSWAAGIVGAPVTDWRDYDSIYTERLMKLPKNNPDGYRRTAPRFAADRLHGKMLLIHGMTDDNVHVQNSIQFAYELQRAGKTFEMMLYPRTRHGVSDARLNAHLWQGIFDFVMKTVGR